MPQCCCIQPHISGTGVQGPQTTPFFQDERRGSRTLIPRCCLEHHVMNRVRQLTLVWTKKREEGVQKRFPQHLIFP